MKCVLADNRAIFPCTMYREYCNITYLKDDILKLTHNTITFAVSGLQADKLKKYLPASEKVCEFEYDERERSHSFKIVSDFSKSRTKHETR